MSRLDTIINAAGGGALICDVSPPRGGSPEQLDALADIDADCIYVAYAPSQSVRVDAISVAAYIRRILRREVAFGLATRDMNRITIQSLLLGASWDDLENVVVFRGDPLKREDIELVSEVHDCTPTSLLTDIAEMNRGFDFRGRKLASPLSLCAGATADTGREMRREVRLVARKVRAGALFLLCQSGFDASEALTFARELQDELHPQPMPPLFVGVQIPSPNGIYFRPLTPEISSQIESGTPGIEVAKQYILQLWDGGLRNFYIVPPILGGGRRDYDAARELIKFVRGIQTR